MEIELILGIAVTVLLLLAIALFYKYIVEPTIFPGV